MALASSEKCFICQETTFRINGSSCGVCAKNKRMEDRKRKKVKFRLAKVKRKNPNRIIKGSDDNG